MLVQMGIISKELGDKIAGWVIVIGLLILGVILPLVLAFTIGPSAF